MQVFSELPHPLQGETAAGIPFAIMPGVSEVDDDAWAELKDDPRIVARMDNRRLRPNYDPLRRDLMTLLDPVSRHYIRELSSKSQQIADGQLFDNNKGELNKLLRGQVSGSVDARIMALEKQIAALKKS